MVILNPNPSLERQSEHTDDQQHATRAWDHFISASPAKHIVAIARGGGGQTFYSLLKARYEQLQRRIAAVAFAHASHEVSGVFGA